MLSDQQKLLLWIKREISYLIMTDDKIDLLMKFKKSVYTVYSVIGYPSPSVNEVIPSKYYRLVKGSNIIGFVKSLKQHFSMITYEKSKEFKVSTKNKIDNALKSINKSKLYKMMGLCLYTIKPATREDLVISLIHVAFKVRRNQIFPDEINFLIL